MVTPAARREAVAHLEQGYEMSERRACSLIGADRSSVRYRHRRPDDAALREVLREAAETHRWFGYRRLHVILRRDGHVLNRKRTQRLYREEGLSVRRRRSRKRAIGTRAPLVTEAMANARWSVDFVQDQFADGRRFRILNVIDDVTKESLAAVVDTSISGRRVARELTALMERRGKPGVIVSDNGTELTSNAVLRWAAEQAGRCGRTLLIEPINPRDMPGYVLQRQADAHAVVDAVGSPHLQVQMDLYHCQIVEGDLATQLRRYLPTGRVGHVQIAGVPERHEPDQGEVHYPYLFAQIDALGYRGWIGCEYRPRGATSAGLGWVGAAVSKTA